MVAEAVVAQANKRENTFQPKILAHVKALTTHIRKLIKITHCTEVQCLRDINYIVDIWIYIAFMANLW